LENYAETLSDPIYVMSYLQSVETALIVTAFCLVLGYPTALFIARSPDRRRRALLPLVVIPFWVSSLIRAYAWISILHGGGPVVSLLHALGTVHERTPILGTPLAVTIAMVYNYLPFMILPLYAQLERADASLLEAAANLGARPWSCFWRITVPLSWPGIAAGSLLVFIPSIGEYVVPELLGGPGNIMIGRMLWNEFFVNRDWPMSAAVAILLLCVVVGPLMVLRRFQTRLEARS
jgi:putrescine transport system permease protein